MEFMIAHFNVRSDTSIVSINKNGERSTDSPTRFAQRDIKCFARAL